MTRSEARKEIIKRNKLRKTIKNLRSRLWREPSSAKGFSLWQDQLKDAEKELKDGAIEHRKALSVFISIKGNV